MNTNAHIFSLDTVIKIKQRIWLIDKTKPSIPIFKIDPTDLNLYESGIFRAQGNSMNFNGKEYWLPNDFMERLKIKVKNIESKMSNLGLSIQEFANKELIENLEYDILEGNFRHLKNSHDDIYIICPRRDRIKYEKFLDKLKEKLAEVGLKIKGFYHINEKFYNQSNDDIAFNKIKIVIQHLIGLKTKNDKFIDEEITKYPEIFFYDDSDKAITLGKTINNVFDNIYNKIEDEGIRLKIQEAVKTKPIAHIIQVTTNKLLHQIDHIVELKLDKRFIKTYESFKRRINPLKG
jgi:hypothetical protein